RGEAMPARRAAGRWRLLALAAVLAVVPGCSGGPARHDLSGKVTFDGRPIPAGVSWFGPGPAAENGGAQGGGEFRGGDFDTRKGGRGHSGGAYVVRIQGYDGTPANEFPMGRPLFPEYRTRIELPRETTTRDFDVPAPGR